MAKKTSYPRQTVEIPHGAEIIECMHCGAKVWMKPIDPSIAKQEFKAINFPAGTVHMCKGLRKAQAKHRRR